MLHSKLKLVIIILILLVSGCTIKDELTHPVKVLFKIGIVPESSSVTGPEYLDFTECQIGIKSIRFEGKREAGGDVYFETDPKDVKTITFLEPALISEFDIPQGIYYYMEWDIAMRCIEGYDPCMGIIIKGNYYSLAGPEIPFIFEIEQPEVFNVRAGQVKQKIQVFFSLTKN